MKAIILVVLTVLLPAVSAFDFEYVHLPDVAYRAYGFDTSIGIEPELSDWHATVAIPELGIVERSRDKDNSRNAHVFLGVPYAVMPGEYLVRVQVVHERDNGETEKRFMHRWIYIE